MSDIEPNRTDMAIAAMPDVAREMAAFTAQLELHGYTRGEAVRLTGEWLTALIRPGDAA